MGHHFHEVLNGLGCNLGPQLDLQDAQLLRLVQTLQADLEADSPVGSLFGEMIAETLALYVSQRYSGPLSLGEPTGGLLKPQLTRVLEYIDANLDRNIHLKELADTAGLSSFHFTKLFRRSVGRSPHQYILERRLERAKELLRDRSISIVEVSLRTGFADQSHLANVFRRFGFTPSRFRALL